MNWDGRKKSINIHVHRRVAYLYLCKINAKIDSNVSALLVDF